MADRNRREIWGVVQREGMERGIWTRIGTAFENQDGSWNLLFDFVPTGSGTTIQMRKPKPKEVEHPAA